jgi:polyisoprenoid-binding protein YceI
MTDPAAAAAGWLYAIDARGSRLTIRAFAAGMLSAVGHDPVIAVRDLQGEVAFDAATPDTARVQLRIAADSLSVQNDVSDKDRREIERAMKQDVLEIATFAEIGFESTAVRIDTGNGRMRVDVDGQLSLHGVTRRQHVSGQVFLMGDTLRAQGETTLRQTDFQITLVSALGGALKIKDEVKLSFELLARKAP